MTEAYTFDATRRFWRRQGASPLHYTDGADVEDYLLETLRITRDLSSASAELASHIRDWPSEYHLSPARHNLLRFIEIRPSHRILEFGSGCGAITRYLGECGATVVAVEGSDRRAAIVAERCRDLANVRVHCENLERFESPENFDLVTMIGVLEYAPLFLAHPDPVARYLERAADSLAPNGSLLLAIENQIGLKYLNGCSEDHTGIPYFGINDLYGPGTPITFGRLELEARLRAAGFNDLSFYFPFPDYKLPNVILTESAVSQSGFRPADLLYRSFSRDYGGSLDRAFYEGLALQALARNGLITELANSFLVIARKNAEASRSHPTWFARLYSTDRLPEFATETNFLHDGDRIVVAKKHLFPNLSALGKESDRHFRHRPSSCTPYVFGSLYVTELQTIMGRGGGITEVARWAAPWVKQLSALGRPGPNRTVLLPAECLDMIPANLVKNDMGALVEIDVEWSCELPVPLAWVLIRGLVNALTACPCSPALADLTFREVVNGVMNCLNHNLIDADYRAAITLENALHDTVYGSRRDGVSLAELLDGHLRSFTSPPTFAQELIKLRQELTRVKSTVSWKITKPLRGFWNISRLLRPSDTAKR